MPAPRGGWWRRLDAFAAETGEPVIVVLDGGEPPPAEHAEVVVASRRGRNAADDEIVALLQDRGAEGVRVVTSDASWRGGSGRSARTSRAPAASGAGSTRQAGHRQSS